MIYIYEGVDMSGKSTLAKKQATETGFPIIKKRLDILNMGPDLLSSNQIELATQLFFESVFPLGQRYDFILDRGLLSSLVYSKYFNRTVSLGYVYKYLINPLNSKDIKIYLITANEESLTQRFMTRGEKLFTLKAVLLIQTLYLEAAKNLIELGCDRIQIIENNNADIPTISNV